METVPNLLSFLDQYLIATDNWHNIKGTMLDCEAFLFNEELVYKYVQSIMAKYQEKYPSKRKPQDKHREPGLNPCKVARPGKSVRECLIEKTGSGDMVIP